MDFQLLILDVEIDAGQAGEERVLPLPAEAAEALHFHAGDIHLEINTGGIVVGMQPGGIFEHVGSLSVRSRW
jgi:hypothetical protein